MKRCRTLLLCCAFSAAAAQAHVASNGFVDIEAHGGTLEGSIELAVRDVRVPGASRFVLTGDRWLPGSAP